MGSSETTVDTGVGVNSKIHKETRDWKVGGSSRGLLNETGVRRLLEDRKREPWSRLVRTHLVGGEN